MTAELVKFDLTEKEIAKRLNFDEEALKKVNEEYMAIVVKSVDDKSGFDEAHEARMKIVKFRGKIVKDAKAFRDEANTFSKNVIKVEKYIVGLVTPVEEHLQAQEDIINNEKARIKADADAKEAARIQARIDRLFDFGCSFNGMNYVLPFAPSGYSVPSAIVKTCSDEQFETICVEFQKLVYAENARKEKEAAEKKAEEERLKKVRVEQEAKQKELDAIAEEQRKKEAAIKAEQDAIEKEKQKIEHEKQIEIAKKEAAEKAVKDAEEKRLKEEKEKDAKAEQERIDAEKKAALAPDKEKLKVFINSISFTEPHLKTFEAKEYLADFMAGLQLIVKTLNDKVEKM
jgi:hypothetical protein